MALFGAPVATDNDALRCVRAGLELQRVLARQPADAAARCASGSASPPARRWSTSPPPATAARRSSPATWSTPPPGCRRSRPRAARSSTRAPTRPPGTTSSTPTSPRSPCADGPRRAGSGWRCPGPAAAAGRGPPSHPDGRPGARARPAGQRAAPDGQRPTAQLVTVFGPAGIGKSRLLRELARHAGQLPDRRSPGWSGTARRSARTSPTPRWPTSSRPRRAPRHRRPGAAARTARAGGWPNWSTRASGAGWPDALGPAARPGRRPRLPPGRDRGGLAAVPARPGRHRPDRAGLRGHALGRPGDAALRRAARRGRARACRCWWSRPPGRSCGTAPGLDRHHQRRGVHLAAPAARHRHRHPLLAAVRPGGARRRPPATR